MSQQFKVIGHGVQGDIDRENFPGLLKAAIRTLLTSPINATIGPAVTPDLLRLMKEYLSEGIKINESEYVVKVCMFPPPAPSDLVARKGWQNRQPFFVLVPKHPIRKLSRTICIAGSILAPLREF